MIPETAVAMLACARIGAIHSVVFGGFSPEALKGRIEDCESRVVITADEGVRGGKKIPLKANVDEALAGLATTRSTRSSSCATPAANIAWQAGRDHWYHEIEDAVGRSVGPGADERRGPAIHSLYVGLDR